MDIPLIFKYLSKVSKDKKLIFSWINPKSENVSSTLVYSAEENGDSSSAFHNLCNKIGLTSLVIGETTYDEIFGGYTSES